MPRPSKPRLSKDKIHRAALELVDRDQDFTMPQLAARLGVSPSSLYHHVKGGRAEIIDGLRARIGGQTRHLLHETGASWDDRVRQWARAYHAALSRHPFLIPVLVGESVDDTPTLDLYEDLATVLREAGLRGEDLVLGLSLVDVWVLGAAVDAASPEPLWDTDPEKHPVLHDAVRSVSTGRAARTFELGLDAVISELRSVLERSGRP
ncbi:TetR/AcrR family transcriptional regulator C-terminal domain-containing protein [Kocuria turfanensis]|uniref:TetR/AcrR family transcriptional regulator C-terminal domain-containing protein n=1 Tax=Kocuria turfanensis TaxID=388357 RepID=UPI00403756A4